MNINHVLKDFYPNTNNIVENSFVEDLVTKIANIKNEQGTTMLNELNSKTRFQSTFNEDTNKLTSDYR